MKKKFVIPVIIGFLMILGIGYFVLKNNDSYASIIYLDINPSLEIHLDKDDKVLEIIGLNEDGKELIQKNSIGMDLEEALNQITENAIDKEYPRDNQLYITVYSEGKIDNNIVEGYLMDRLGEKNIEAIVIKIDKISKKDKELAKKYEISPAKVVYLNTILKENSKLTFEGIYQKSIGELQVTKNTGFYCEGDYVLEGEVCLKEKERIPALQGNICPVDYLEYNGNCYEETKTLDGENLICREGFQLKGNECVDEGTYDAFIKCSVGELRGNECIDRKIVAEAYEFCRDPGRTLYDHKCLATKPTINGGCLNGDLLYNGTCVNTRDDYYMAEWKCPNGQVKSRDNGELEDNDTHCYEETKVEPSEYYCNREDKLEGKICIKTAKEKPRLERICPEGYTLTENERCINLNKTAEKVEGYYCENDNRLDNNKCILYDVIDAKK